MGNVRDHPTREDLSQSHAWKLMFQFKDYVNQNYKECKYIKFCRGGCPYNAMAPTDCEIKGVDPHCVAYKRAFKEIMERWEKEFLGGGSDLDMPFMLPGMKRDEGKPGIMAIMTKRL